MLRKNKLLLIVLSSCLVALPAQAGGLGNAAKGLRHLRQKARVTTPKVSKPRTVSSVRKKPGLVDAARNLRTLNARVERTFNQALAAQQEATHLPSILSGPAKRIKGASIISPLSAKRMYADKPFLQHPLLGPQLTEAYFLAQNNRLFINYVREMESFWAAFEAAIPRFEQEAKALAQPTNLLEWTVEQIPANVKDLFIGEVHDQHEITQFVSELLPRLRAQNPTRQIFLFTEFIYDNSNGGNFPADLLVEHSKKHYYYPVWESAQELGIPLIGMEGSKAASIHPIKMADPEGNMGTDVVGAAPEGIRLRNEYWWNILQRYRQENPDALFVIYTGSFHSMYNYPMSLAKRLSKKTTFVIDLTMEKLMEDGEATYKTDNLETLNPNLSFPQPVLKWSSPDLIELSGFDIRIKLPKTTMPEEIIQQDMMEFQSLNRSFPATGM